MHVRARIPLLGANGVVLLSGLAITSDHLDGLEHNGSVFSLHLVLQKDGCVLLGQLGWVVLGLLRLHQWYRGQCFLVRPQFDHKPWLLELRARVATHGRDLLAFVQFVHQLILNLQVSVGIWDPHISVLKEYRSIGWWYTCAGEVYDSGFLLGEGVVWLTEHVVRVISAVLD